MDKEQATRIISNYLEKAQKLIEEALTLGRVHGVEVRLEKLGITENMWYVDEVEYREQYIEDNYSTYNEATGEYDTNLTPEEEAEVERHMQAIRDDGGYDGSYKVLGWMSSSTNC